MRRPRGLGRFREAPCGPPRGAEMYTGLRCRACDLRSAVRTPVPPQSAGVCAAYEYATCISVVVGDGAAEAGPSTCLAAVARERRMLRGGLEWRSTLAFVAAGLFWMPSQPTELSSA